MLNESDMCYESYSEVLVSRQCKVKEPEVKNAVQFTSTIPKATVDVS